MLLRPKQDLLAIAVTQLSILNAAWAFYIVVSIKNPLPLPDTTAMWVYQNPTETTVVVTVIATIVSSMTLRYTYSSLPSRGCEYSVFLYAAVSRARQSMLSGSISALEDPYR